LSIDPPSSVQSLWEGVEKCTLCTLVKTVIIMDDLQCNTNAIGLTENNFTLWGQIVRVEYTINVPFGIHSCGNSNSCAPVMAQITDINN
jgi:hypothetical protein